VVEHAGADDPTSDDHGSCGILHGYALWATSPDDSAWLAARQRQRSRGAILQSSGFEQPPPGSEPLARSPIRGM